MKYIAPLLIVLLLLGASACEQKSYPKPGKLIKPKELIDVLYDLHMAEALSTHYRYRAQDSMRVTSQEAYQAVLDKYNLNDSVLASNLVYYSGRPKEYEKIYKEVVDRLNQNLEEHKQKADMTVNEPEE